MMEDTPKNDSGGVDTDSGALGSKDSGFVGKPTYDRAIDEIKNFKGKYREAQAELNEYKVKEQQLTEQKLLDEKRHLEVIEQLKSQNESLSKEVTSHVQDKLDFRKMNAAMSLLQSKGVNLESKYLGLLPIDQIEVTDSGEIDNTSVTSVIENFQKEHPRLTLPATKLLPNDKPGSNSGKISLEEWKKLSPKDRQAAYKEGRVKRL